MDDQAPVPVQRERVPAFNVPGILLAIFAVLTLIHAARYLLTHTDDLWVIYAFGFTPARYAGRALDLPFPLGGLGDVIGFATYALLHGGWMHLFANSLWLVAFGSPVARRFGPVRFLLLGFVSAIGGALAHLITHWGEPVPMVGASAAVSGYMAAAIRFAFVPDGPLTPMGRRDPASALRAPAASIVEAFRIPAVVMFVVVWAVFNTLFGAASYVPGTGTSTIAWEAHVGGFLVGLLLFALFDPIGRNPEPEPLETADERLD